MALTESVELRYTTIDSIETKNAVESRMLMLKIYCTIFEAEIQRQTAGFLLKLVSYESEALCPTKSIMQSRRSATAVSEATHTNTIPVGSVA